MSEQVFRILSSKLGIAEDSDSVIRKASELKRLISLKTNVSNGLSHLDETCVSILCLNMAASSLNTPFDRVVAMKLSRLTKPAYLRSLHSIEKILGFENKITIPTLAVKLGVPDVTRTATEIFNCYKLEVQKTNVDKDLSHPMYICAAVKAAAKRSRIPVDRQSLVESCRVKANELEKLTAKMAAAYETDHGGLDDKLRKRKAKRGFLDAVEDAVRDSEASSVKILDDGQQGDDENDKVPKESLEDWKKRILGN